MAGIVLVGLASVSQACSHAFWNKYKGYMIVGRAMDLPFGDHTQLAVFPRGIERNGLANGVGGIRWTSRYASVGIVSGDVATTDGMNEKGLDANVLSLDGGDWGERDPSIPGLSYRLWVQYFLDTCATVDEVIEKSKNLQIVNDVKTMGMFWPIHLAVSDASGDSAILEYLSGKLTVHHGKQFNVLTNEPPYDQQLTNLRKYTAFGGKQPLPGTLDPLARFVRAQTFLDTLTKPKNQEDAISKLYGVMRTVAVPRGSRGDYDGTAPYKHLTYWFTFADLSSKTYYYQSTHNLNMIWVKLNELPIATGNPIRMLDAAAISQYGDASPLLAKAPAAEPF